MDLGLKDKVALVVAASKGMGKATALGLAAEGARVAMCARGETDLKAAAADVAKHTGAEVLAVAADANRTEDIDRVVSRTRERWGGVDILVANVGGPPPGPFEQMSDEQWKAAFEQVHLSTVRFIRAVLPDMKRKRWGRILAIQSSSVKQPVEGLILSNGVRPGIAGMFKTLANELGREGITVSHQPHVWINAPTRRAGSTPASRSLESFRALARFASLRPSGPMASGTCPKAGGGQPRAW